MRQDGAMSFGLETKTEKIHIDDGDGAYLLSILLLLFLSFLAFGRIALLHSHNMPLSVFPLSRLKLLFCCVDVI